MFRLAHITDPHFQSWKGARLANFFGKRAFGAANILLNRGRFHRMELLEHLREDLQARPIDHLVITGDLSNVSLEGEWKEARRWLDALGGDGEKVTVIPGNHDAYVPEVVRARTFERIFEPFQTAELRTGNETYPFVRVRDDIALIGVNTCVATGDMHAWGVIGDQQRARLEALLRAPELAGKLRVVLLHHPPVAHRGGEDRNLRDRGALAALLARTGADLVLHGHDHRELRAVLEGPGGTSIPVVGTGSASYVGHNERRSRYNIYEIEGRKIAFVVYVHDEATGRYREVRRETVSA